MPRNELLVFRILNTLRRWRAHPLEERSLLAEIARMPDTEYNVEIVRAHIHVMLLQGLLKQVAIGEQRQAYTLDWAGYDYLESQ
ncbi:hypothetical protein [Paludibacterium paludis]|nr:hypothetical protein [Paludibacterium paludis]